MRLRKLIKHFVFDETNRSRIELGTDTRLNPITNRLQLKENTSGEYSTADDLYAKTWVANPSKIVQWLGFEVEDQHFSINGVQVTSLGFRLSDGTDEYFYNGASWEVNTVDWNTEAEIASNISSFPATSRKLQIVINLKTTNATVTPIVRQVKVLYDSAIEFQEDLVYRSLVPLFRESIRPKGRHVVRMVSTSSTIDLKSSSYAIETPYNITGIDAVFNYTDDPNRNVDIFDSYNVSTKIITLTSAIDQGKAVWIDFLWEPEIIVTTSQDYSEIEKVPSVVLDDIKLIEASETGQSDSVFNRSTGEGWKLFPPLQGDLEINLYGFTDKAIDQMRLADELKRFFGNNPLMVSTGLDESYTLWLVDEYDMSTVPNRAEVHSGQLLFRVRDVCFWIRDAQQSYMVEQLNLQGDMNQVVD